MLYKKFLRMSYEKFLGIGYKKFLGIWYEKFLRIGSNIFSGNSHKKISSPGQTPATVPCGVFIPEISQLKTFPWKFSRKSPISVDIWSRIFPRLIPGNFRGFLGISTDFPQIFFLCNIEKFIIDVKKFIESKKKQICVFLE